jgi:hypothetical protein
MNAVVQQDNPFGSNAIANKQADSMVAVEAQRAIAEVQAMAIMAKKFPRDQVVAMDRILNACTRPTLAESALYTYSRGGTEITGPSIRLAEALAQQWGNFLFGLKELEQRNGESTMQAYAIDLETITKSEKVFQVKHWRDTKQGGYALKDSRDIYELTANQGARRLRACILGVIPGDVVEAAVKQCEATLATKAEVTPERLKSLLGKFAEFGVTREQIEKRIQRHLDAMTPAQMVDLGKKYNSLKDGMSTVADWFEVAPAAAEGDTGKGSASVLKAAADRARNAATRKSADQPAPTPAATDGPGFTDEATALLAIDGAGSREEADEIVDLCRGQSFEKSIAKARDTQFQKT